ncbi:MAG: hypothetical protein ACI8RD_001781, partial [Bacillariaceae sp.]
WDHYTSTTGEVTWIRIDAKYFGYLN